MDLPEKILFLVVFVGYFVLWMKNDAGKFSAKEKKVENVASKASKPTGYLL